MKAEGKATRNSWRTLRGAGMTCRGKDTEGVGRFQARCEALRRRTFPDERGQYSCLKSIWRCRAPPVGARQRQVNQLRDEALHSSTTTRGDTLSLPWCLCCCKKTLDWLHELETLLHRGEVLGHIGLEAGRGRTIGDVIEVLSMDG